MSDSVATFDPGRYKMVFRGREVSQFMDGTFITLKRDEAAFKKKVGGQGTPVRVRSRNTCGSCEVVLQETSPSNDDFSEAADLDELDIAIGQGELFFVDLNGRTVAHAAQAWVQKRPDVEGADDLSGRKWMLDTGPLELFIGGANGTLVIG